jgi:hypothetical protein
MIDIMNAIITDYFNEFHDAIIIRDTNKTTFYSSLAIGYIYLIYLLHLRKEKGSKYLPQFPG